MPPTQRPRPSPPLPAAAMPPVERAESPPVARVESPAPRVDDPARRVERMPKPDAISMILGQRRSPAPSVPSIEVPMQSPDRCPGCHESYSAPVPASWGEQKPAKNAMDFAKATEGFFALQRENAQVAADDYRMWKEKHTSCSGGLSRDPPSTSNGTTDGHSNKRKNDTPHEDTARSRRTAFDGHTPAHPVRPTAPAV
jgi:hypothetical protein